MKYNAQNMYKSCLRKKKYHTEEYAKRVADKFGQYVYFCPLCGYWHITKRKPK